MERFIVEYTDSDGCTYSADVIRPVVATSKEEIYSNIIDQARKSLAAEECEFSMYGHIWPVQHILTRSSDSEERFEDLRVYSIEEWFKDGHQPAI